MSSAQRARLLGAGAVLAAAALAAGACGSSSGDGRAASGGDTVSVVASTNVYGDIARRIGGDGSRSPRSSATPPRTRTPTRPAPRTSSPVQGRVVIENGGGYDDFVDRMLRAPAPGPRCSTPSRSPARTAPTAGSSTSTSGTTSRGRGSPTASPPRSRRPTPRRRALRGERRRPSGQAAGAWRRQGGELEARTPARRSPSPSPCRSTCSSRSGSTTRRPTRSARRSRRARRLPAVLQETLDLFTREQVKALVYNAQTSGPQTEQVEQAAKDRRHPRRAGDRDPARGQATTSPG